MHATFVESLRSLYYRAKLRIEPRNMAYHLALLECDLSRRSVNQFGRIKFMGYDIEYVDSRALYNMIKINIIDGYNDFYTTCPSPRILDCGSNIGISIIRYKQLYPKAKITAFEADPRLCKLLKRNIKYNNLTDIDVVEAAVWSSDTTVQFVRTADPQGGYVKHVFDQHGDVFDQHGECIRGISLSRFLQEPVDLLKLDIEGGEFEVLPSIKDKLDNVKQIMLEVHHSVTRADRLAEIFDILSNANYNVVINLKYAPYSNKPYVPNKQGFDQPFLIWAWR